jgi:hypothetical protein
LPDPIPPVNPTSSTGLDRRVPAVFRRRANPDDALYAGGPADRLDAARRLDAKAVRRVQAAVDDWPALSPSAANAWLLFVTTKPPQWRDPLLEFPEGPLTLGEPHPGFLYPDPIGFWGEVRRWAGALARTRAPGIGTTDAVAVSGLVHVGDQPARVAMAMAVVRAEVVVFLDESAWAAAALAPERVQAHHVPDPHRPGQVYQGLWGRLEDGSIVGKAPQHPAMHRLYDHADMDRFLASCPRD